MKYNTLDRNDLHKFFNVLYRLGRSCQDFRKDGACAKSVFVRRTLNKWIAGKYFTIIEEKFTGAIKSTDEGYNINNMEKFYIPMKNYVAVGGIYYHLGYGEELDINFCYPYLIDGHLFMVKKVNFSQLVEIRFKEITEKKFNQVQKMFRDDSDKKE